MTIADGICELASVSVGRDERVCGNAGNKAIAAVPDSPPVCVG